MYHTRVYSDRSTVVNCGLDQLLAEVCSQNFTPKKNRNQKKLDGK